MVHVYIKRSTLSRSIPSKDLLSLTLKRKKTYALIVLETSNYDTRKTLIDVKVNYETGP